MTQVTFTGTIKNQSWSEKKHSFPQKKGNCFEKEKGGRDSLFTLQLRGRLQLFPVESSYCVWKSLFPALIFLLNPLMKH